VPIVLAHHAQAVGPEVDAMRPLSSVGLAVAARVATLAASRGIAPTAIWHSGKLRARQTAEAYWKACNPFASLTAVRGLLPDDPPTWIRDRLTGETRTIVVVGHMPHLPRLLALLASGVDDGSRAPFPLYGCVALEPELDGWRELWRVEA
jgi:phosphohistidine phosphatase